MGQHYGHLSVCERNFLQSSLNKERSRSWVAGVLGRSRSTIWREVKRWGADCGTYDAAGAGEAARARRRRGLVKLREGTALRSHVFAQIRLGWSPQQICGRLSRMRDSGAPELPGLSHETVYRAVYILPRGEIRRQIIGLLRQAKTRRGPRSTEKEKRGGLIDMISIHDRPAEALTRQFPGDWVHQGQRQCQRRRHADRAQKPLHRPCQNGRLRIRSRLEGLYQGAGKSAAIDAQQPCL